MSSILRLTAILGSAVSVLGHGYVTSIDVDGTTYGGYLIDTYYYESNPPDIIAWSTTATDTGYVAPTAYDDPDIICHRGAEPGALSAEIAPGGSVTLYWSTWPTDHHGPVITYLAECDGDCASVDKTTLEFFKIDEGGLIDNSAVPGTWASDELIADNFSRTITIPSDIKSGNYVLRHEIIALHGAGTLDAAQNYPQCINLKVTGDGTATPAGTLGTELYKDTDAGILVNIWNALSSYEIPGPALYTAGSSDTATASSSSSSASVSTAPTASAASTSTTTSSSSTSSSTAEATTTTTATLTTPDTNEHVATSTQSPAPVPTTTGTTEQTTTAPESESPTSVASQPSSVQTDPPTTSQSAIPPPTETGTQGSASGTESSAPTSTPCAGTGDDNTHGRGHHGSGRRKGGKKPGFRGGRRRHARDLAF
ncbi:glycosyl hydrolase family 61-domain-containing protein [Aspergillus keveii]|uniref:Glycosyl hydrolase family 61-domain-containing protein n=1 Tax=Aspergillus keveii TaxID=714993 RepID=A0ABR4GAF8_9EURO